MQTIDTDNQLRFKAPMVQSDLCDQSDVYTVVKENIAVKRHMTRNQLLKIMHHLLAAFQKLTIPLLIIQKTQILHCQFIICLSIAKMFQRHEEVYGNVIDMNKVVVKGVQTIT